MGIKAVWGFDPDEVVKAQNAFQRLTCEGEPEVAAARRSVREYRPALIRRFMNFGGCSGYRSKRRSSV